VKRIIFLPLLILILFCFLMTSSEKEPAKIRIMCLGDSITDGKCQSNDECGYRRYLYQKLIQVGYKVDFVGSCHTGLKIDFDNDHEGHPAYTAKQVTDNISQWLEANPPDIILLHIGTNCFQQTTQANIEEILINIHRYEEKHHHQITVFVAKIINRQQPSEYITKYNDDVELMIKRRIQNGDSLVVVNVESALRYPEDMFEKLHPNDSGYQKIAQVWFESLDQFLSSTIR